MILNRQTLTFGNDCQPNDHDKSCKKYLIELLLIKKLPKTFPISSKHTTLYLSFTFTQNMLFSFKSYVCKYRAVQDLNHFNSLCLICFQVMSNIKSVDTKLSEQIKYLTQVSTGHPHEGSSYPSQKVLQSAWHRLEHVKTRINELDRLRHQAGLSGLTPAQKQAIVKQQQQQSPAPGSVSSNHGGSASQSATPKL